MDIKTGHMEEMAKALFLDKRTFYHTDDGKLYNYMGESEKGFDFIEDHDILELVSKATSGEKFAAFQGMTVGGGLLYRFKELARRKEIVNRYAILKKDIAKLTKPEYKIEEIGYKIIVCNINNEKFKGEYAMVQGDNKIILNNYDYNLKHTSKDNLTISAVVDKDGRMIATREEQYGGYLLLIENKLKENRLNNGMKILKQQLLKLYQSFAKIIGPEAAKTKLLDRMDIMFKEDLERHKDAKEPFVFCGVEFTSYEQLREFMDPVIKEITEFIESEV